MTEKHIIDNGFYAIHFSENQSLSLTIENNSEKNDSKIVLEEWKSLNNQIFYILYDSEENNYSIIVFHTSKTIGSFVRKPESGDYIIQFNMSFEPNFKWNIIDLNNGTFEFQIVSTGLFIGSTDKNNIELSFQKKDKKNENKILQFSILKQDIDTSKIQLWLQLLPQAKELSVSTEFSFPEGIKTITPFDLSIFQNLRKIKIPLSVESVDGGLFGRFHLEEIECDPKYIKTVTRSREIVRKNIRHAVFHHLLTYNYRSLKSIATDLFRRKSQKTDQAACQ